MRNRTGYTRSTLALLLTLIAALGSGLAFSSSAQAAKINWKKAYWHQVGSDRFRAFDAGGTKGEKSFRIPLKGDDWVVTIPWFSGEPPASAAGPSPYRSNYSAAAWSDVKDTIRNSNKEYARRVDWPVTAIFRNQASVPVVEEFLWHNRLNSRGDNMFLSLADNASAGAGSNLWSNASGGLKEAWCSGRRTIPGTGLRIFPETTNHIRLYADASGSGPSANRDKMMENRYWGYYVLATTHMDHRECEKKASVFGWSEETVKRLYPTLAKAFGDWNPGCTVNGKRYSHCYDVQPLKNKVYGRQDNHIWENDGKATVIRVGDMRASASINDPGDEEDLEQEEGEGEEPEPELEPAIDGDVDGDDKADLVALNTSGTAYTYKGSDGSSKTTAFGGGMNSALFDGVEHHVIDVADVDADGYSDLVTLSFNSALGINNVVCVFPGQSDGSFGSGILARGGVVPGTFGPNGHEPIGVADVTGDRRADLVTFYAPQGNFYVYPGLESGQFGEGMTMGGGQVNSALFDREGTYFLDVKDVDGDEQADLVGVSAHGPYNSYGAALTYEGTSQGIKQWPTQIHPQIDSVMNDGSGHEPIGLGDVNGDGKADLVTLNSSGSASVYAGMHTLNEATQTYQFLDKNPVNSLSSLNSSFMDETGDDFVTLIDKTGDGRDDLVKVAADGTVSVAPGETNLQFGAFAQWATGVTSNRFNKGSYELLQEKPFLRRLGCTSTGCIGRPQPPKSDVDGDRRADLVTLDNTGTSHTYRAIGAGEEATSLIGSMDPALYDGKGHHVIDVVDVNGDWRADKVTLTDGGTVYVHLGRPDGSFGSGIGSFAGAMSPGIHDPAGFEPIAVADVTGDGKGDLVVFKEGQGIKTYPGSTTGEFGSPATSLSTMNSALFDGFGHYFLGVADITGDGYADLATVSQGDGALRVYKGAQNGSFTYADLTNLNWSMEDGTGHEPIGLADVNSDHRADLVTLQAGTGYVYEGKASGKFAGSSPSGTSFEGSLDSNLLDGTGDEIAGLLDENGDSHADLVTAREDGSVRIYRGKDDFTFARTPIARVLPGFRPSRFHYLHGHEIVNEMPILRGGCSPDGCDWPARGVMMDPTRDYRDDLFATMHLNGAVRAFVADSEGTWPKEVHSAEAEVDPALEDGEGSYLIDMADVNNDERGDLVAVEDDGNVVVYRGRPDHTLGKRLESWVSLPPAMSGAGDDEPIAVADVSGDGFDDLVAYIGPDSGKLATFAGQADGRFATQAVYSHTGAVDSALLDGSGHYFLDVIDVTGDGQADLVTMASWGRLVVFKGLSDGKFSTAVTTTTTTVNPILADGSGDEPVGLGDMNADGRSDLLTLDASGNLDLYSGQADGEFSTPSSPYGQTIDSNLLDGTGSELVGLLDYNEDDRADLVALKEGDLMAYEMTSSGLEAPVRFDWNISSVRDQSTGYEFLAEKPFLRRLGCSSTGCEWTVADPKPPLLPYGDSDSENWEPAVAFSSSAYSAGCEGAPAEFESTQPCVVEPQSGLSGNWYLKDTLGYEGDCGGSLGGTVNFDGTMEVSEAELTSSSGFACQFYKVTGLPWEAEMCAYKPTEEIFTRMQGIALKERYGGATIVANGLTFGRLSLEEGSYSLDFSEAETGEEAPILFEYGFSGSGLKGQYLHDAWFPFKPAELEVYPASWFLAEPTPCGWAELK